MRLTTTVAGKTWSLDGNANSRPYPLCEGFRLEKSPYLHPLNEEDFRMRRHADLFRLRAQFASGAKQGAIHPLLLPSKLFLH